jgi:hypothetical protein
MILYHLTKVSIMERKDDQKAAASSSNKQLSRRAISFVNGASIDREVITTDIFRYLGNDALVKPGTYQVGHRIYLGLIQPVCDI